jgi:hypothetical protein
MRAPRLPLEGAPGPHGPDVTLDSPRQNRGQPVSRTDVVETAVLASDSQFVRPGAHEDAELSLVLRGRDVEGRREQCSHKRNRPWGPYLVAISRPSALSACGAVPARGVQLHGLFNKRAYRRTNVLDSDRVLHQRADRPKLSQP